jgi:AcrR family transcriptional regulator
LTDKKADVFNAGRELFYSKGFKNTNISEIAKISGIGVGTFYNYYASKEELFLKIYIKENEALKTRLIQSIDINDDPVTFVTKLVTRNITEMNTNLILKEWYNKDLFTKLEKYFFKKDGFKSIEELMQSGMKEMIKKWKTDGNLRNDIDDDMIIAIFNSIPYIDIHKNEIGIQHFPKILVYLMEFVMKGLTERSK